MSWNICLFQFEHHFTHGKVVQRQEKHDSFVKFDVCQDLVTQLQDSLLEWKKELDKNQPDAGKNTDILPN